jgi:hypothetical protein
MVVDSNRNLFYDKIYHTMRKILKIVLIASVLMSMSTYLAAASIGNDVIYRYDAAGNRISRIMVHLGPNKSSSKPTVSGEVSVYPTVTDGMVNVELRFDTNEGNNAYIITTLQGNVVMSGDLNSSNAQIQLSCPSGIYLLHVSTDRGKHVFKIIKK